MKPKTKIQKEVKELSDTFYPNTSNKIICWAESECLPCIGLRNKTSIACLECGYVWKRDNSKKRCVCPSCHSKLMIEDTRDRVREQKDYFLVLDTCRGYQVCRFYKIVAYYKFGEKAYKNVSEVCQFWITESGKVVIYALRHKVSWSQDFWAGEFEIRSNKDPYHRYWKNNLYNLNTRNYYPENEILPILRQRGVNGKFGGVRPLDVILSVLKDNRAESLLKMKQYNLLNAYIAHSWQVDRFWRSICICQRNGYKVKDASLWLDYLGVLEDLGKDLRNPHYICPKNLLEEHDLCMKKRRKRDEKMRYLRMKEDAKSKEEKYRKDKEPFLGLVFQKEDLSVSVLNSVQEFIEEGEYLKHCVYDSAYYEKKSSLIFSAKAGGVSIATIELSLDTGEILQCRGKFNAQPERYDEIIEIVQQNLVHIRSRIAS